MIFKIVKTFFSANVAAFFLFGSVPSEEAGHVFIWFLALLSLTLAFVAISYHKERFRRLAALSRNIKRGREAKKSAGFYFPPAPTEVESSETEEILLKTNMDSQKADELITDKMAKNLIVKSKPLKVFGKKKGVVSIGELSRVFKRGERVDVNRMKAEGLISYNVSHVKVLCGGIIDKPLFIYANGFSLSAVKMIALAGGKAIKCDTVRIKTPKQMDG